MSPFARHESLVYRRDPCRYPVRQLGQPYACAAGCGEPVVSLVEWPSYAPPVLQAPFCWRHLCMRLAVASRSKHDSLYPGYRVWQVLFEDLPPGAAEVDRHLYVRITPYPAEVDYRQELYRAFYLRFGRLPTWGDVV